MDTSTTQNTATTTTTTTTNTPVPQQPAPSHIRLRIPRRIHRPEFIDEPYITFHCDEVGESYGYGYDPEEVETRHDMSTYQVHSSGRLLAGSKRVARAQENTTDGVVAKDFRFGEDGVANSQGDKGVVAFEGFRGVLRTQVQDFSMGAPEDEQAVKTS